MIETIRAIFNGWVESFKYSNAYNAFVLWVFQAVFVIKDSFFYDDLSIS